MEIPIPQHWKDVWETWDLRFFILLSLFLQTFLIVFAPLRKRIANSWLILSLWSAYLLADWAANFAVGIISSSQSDKIGSVKKSTSDADILAFWAPFLLVHLGGPDTITAFSLEDNELWNRHMLGLIFQSLAAVYVFFISLPKNNLWIPTTLMFISGLIKYSERTWALYLASLNRFRDSMLKDPDPGPNYAKLMDEYYSKKEANLPTRIDMIPEPAQGTKAVNRPKEGELTHIEVVLYAHRFFETFKGLIVDLIFSFRERNNSREFFLLRSPKDAFKVVETELNFMYDVLFTKATVVYNKLGYCLRFLSFGSIVTSLALFYTEDKNNFKPADIAITYSLLLGAIALDVIAFIKLISSDWLTVNTKKLPDVPGLEDKNKTTRRSACVGKLEKVAYGLFGKPIKLVKVLRLRWSKTIASYNLIHYCLNPRQAKAEKLFDWLNLTGILNEFQFVQRKSQFSEDLRDHIFHELWMKSDMAKDLDTAKEISSAKGDWVLRVEGCSELLPDVIEVDYDQSLLLWHIATDLCYWGEEDPAPPPGPSPAQASANINKYREFSKLLSDYMLYLLIMQPTMMSAVAGIGQIRFRDTCAEAKKFFEGESGNQINLDPPCYSVILYGLYVFFKFLFLGLLGLLSPVLVFTVSLFVTIFVPLIHIFCPVPKERQVKALNRIKEYFSKEAEQREKQRRACKRILDVKTEVTPVTVKGDRSKSVLFDGCILAKRLQKLNDTEEGKKIDKWVIMSKVWVEMLSYAAIHCRAQSHAQLLTKGGELITIVWLLMAHFGLGDQFQISEGHARAKLIVEK